MSKTTQRRWTAALALFVVVFVFVVVRELPTPWISLVTSNVVECIAPALAAVGCVLASRRATSTRQTRAWIVLGASAASWCLGQIAWSYYTISGTAAPYPSVADVGYLGAVPLALVGVWMLSSRPSASQRMMSVVDGLIITAGLLTISWLFVLGRAWHAGGDSVLEFALSLAYPAGDLVIVSAVLLVMMRSGRNADSAPLVRIAAAMILLGMADSVFVLATLQDTETGTSIADIAWTSGYLMLFLAALSFPLGREIPAGPVSTTSMRRALLPFTIVTAALAVRVGASIWGHAADPFTIVTTLVMTGLVILRQLLTIRENQELTRSLEEKIGELTTREQQLSHQAFHDPLTGLANRRLFSDRVDHALTRSRRSAEVTAVLFIDLDDFKTVNDSLGHAVGDQLLVAVGSRLSGCVRPGDTVARLGGDEFGILFEEVTELELPATIAQRMLEAVLAPFPITGRQVFTGASIGLAFADGTEPLDGKQLLADADVALYAAKGAGKSIVRRFERAMRVDALERLELGQDLRRALDEDQFFCEYQPIVDLVSGRAEAVEALVRWDHPTRGLILPNSFVELAEDSGMIGQIGKRVLEMATEQCARWREAGEVPANFELHVNLSGRQLEEADLVAQVERVLATAGFPPGQLVLEVTESVAVDIGAKHLERLVGLRDLGVRLAIDDFGTGYSSLNYLRSLPVDVLKIDRAFAQTLDGATDGVLLEAIVRLGHSLGIEMIAEGIERVEQAATLRRLGCRRAQGYLWSRPVDGEHLPGVVASSRTQLAAEADAHNAAVADAEAADSDAADARPANADPANADATAAD